MDPKPLIGLIGGINSGKSTAAACFAHLGCGLVDADQIAHEVLVRPEVIRKITELFGRQVLLPNGLIDRRKLALEAFAGREKLDTLSRIIHPLVLARCETMIRHFQQNPSLEGIVLDMPLLLEVGWENRCDVIVFVDCDPEKRAKRAAKKGVLDIEQQKKRENFQISLDKKKEIAQYILDNNSDESDLAKQVENVFSAIRDRR